MTSQQMSKVWTVISLALLYYALNTYLVTQDGQPIFGATLIVTKRIPAAMMGIPICAVLLLLASLIGIDYARKADGGWADRIPLVGFESIKTTDREARVYQGVMLVLMTVLPLIALGHFWSVFNEAHVITTKNPPVEIPSIWSWSHLTGLNDPARICNIFHAEPGAAGALPTITCDKTNTILPGLEPTAFALLSAAACFFTFSFWWRVLGSQPARGNASRAAS